MTELLATAEMLERIFDSIHVYLAWLDPQFNFIRVNEAYARANGHPPDWFVGKNHFALFPHAENEAIFRRVVESRQPFSIAEKPFDHPGLGKSWWDWSLHPVLDGTGQVEGLVFTLLDVTDRVRSRINAEESAAYARSLIETSPDLLVAVDAMGIITDVNSAAEALVGVPRNEAIGSAFTRYCAEPARALAAFGQVLREGRLHNFPLDLLHRDGHTVPVVVNASVLRDGEGRISGALGTARDVTESRRREQERQRLTEQLERTVADLRRTTALMRHAQHIGHMSDWQSDLHTGLVTWPEQMWRLMGREPGPATFPFGEFLEMVHPEDRRVVDEAHRRAVENGEPYDAELRIPLGNGEERILHARGEVERDERGRPLMLVGVSQDITALKRTEAAFRDYLRHLANTVSDVVWALSPDNRTVLYVNPAFEAIWGRSCEELYRHPDTLPNSIHPDDGRRVATCTLARREREQECEYRIVRPDGRLRWIHQRSFPLHNERGELTAIIGIATDITDARKIRQHLKRTIRRRGRAARELWQLSYHDPLTGVTNRRFLARYVEREWQRERRHCHDMALIMIDIDHFKSYNDRYGHVTGDQCLRQIAQRVASRVRRPTDFVARFGGEEFAVLLSETGLSGAARLAEEIRHSVEDLHIPHEASAEAKVVTVSLGVAAVNACQNDFDELLQRADSALYQAKNRGRNRVEHAD